MPSTPFAPSPNLETKLELPPGPASRGWWPWQQLPNLYRMKARPIDFLTQLAQCHGDISTFLMWTQRGYLLNNPRLIKDLLANEQKDFEKAIWQMGPLRRVVGDGLLTSNGELWRRQRRLVQSAFRMGILPKYAAMTVDMTMHHIQKWEDQPIDLADEMGTLTISTAIRNNLGIMPGEKSERLARAILFVADCLKIEMESIFPLPEFFNRKYHRKRMESIRLIHHFIDQVIENRQQGTENDSSESFNLLYRLMEAVDEEGDGTGMAAKLARDEAITMTIAGNHSVAATLSWIWSMLLHHDEVREKVEQEVLTVIGTERKPTAADLPKLTYTHQVIQETLRLFPSAWVLFSRQALRDTSVGKYKIKRGSWIFIVPFVTHRDERYFPDPLKFDPDRFSEERIGDIPTNAYFPFGTGPHVCVGKHLAMTQLPLFVSTIIQQFEIQPTAQRPPLSISRDLAIRPSAGCWANVKRRKANLKFSDYRVEAPKRRAA